MTTNEIKEQILEAQVEFADVHNFLNAVKMNNVTAEEYNRTNHTSLSQEDFEAAIEDLERDVKNGWTYRLEDMAQEREFNYDASNMFYERFLRGAKLSEVEEFAGMSLDEARETVEEHGTLF